MRNILFLFSFIACCTLHAQTYFAMPSHADWRYRYKKINSPGLCFFYDGQWVTKGIDTLLDGVNYQIVYHRGQGFNSQCDAPLSSFTCNNDDIINTFMRQDGPYVYSRSNGSQPESLLYDFSLDVGEAIPGNYIPTHYVQSIDSILIGNTYRKRFDIVANTSHVFYIIEGIGSDKGLFPAQTPGENWGLQLICFRDSGVVQYSPLGECYYIYEQGTSHVPTPWNDPSLFASPNPSFENVVIDLNGNNFTNLTIFNSLGQQVYAESNVFEGKLSLNQSYFPTKGIFYLLLSNSEKGAFARITLCRL